MKINNVLKIGLAGAVITAINHLFLYYVLEKDLDSMYAYYIVWVIFIIIGIGLMFGKKGEKKPDNKKQVAAESTRSETTDNGGGGGAS